MVGLAAPTFAADGNLPSATLSDMGLSDMQVLSDAQALDVRGKGLLIGMRLDEARQAKDVMFECLDRGLIVCLAKENVLRTCRPPLGVSFGGPSCPLDVANMIV